MSNPVKRLLRSHQRHRISTSTEARTYSLSVGEGKGANGVEKRNYKSQLRTISLHQNEFALYWLKHPSFAYQRR